MSGLTTQVLGGTKTCSTDETHLQIDTEGFDATVVMGAMEAIAKGRVGLVSFEYHEVGVWREYKLEDIVEMLDGMNYVCYMDGEGSA